MPMTASEVEQFVDIELSRFADPALLARFRELRVPVYVVMREWDYGEPGEGYPCWTVAEHREINLGIAFCEYGFGPQSPWGLVFLSGPHMNMGMDAAWFPTLEEASKDLLG